MAVRSSLGRFGIVTAAALNAINAHPDGTPSVLAVYVALSTRADRDEQDAWRCSVNALAEEAGVSERTVRKAKTVLVDLGLVQVSPNWTADGDRGWDSHLLAYTPPAHDAGGTAHVAGGEDDDAGYSSDQLTDQVTEKYIAPSQAMDAVRADDAEAFELFWSAYRRTGSKKKARECWNRAITKASAESILQGLLSWMRYWDTPGAAKMKWPQGWLNEERWNDEPPQVQQRDTSHNRTMAVIGNAVAESRAELDLFTITEGASK